ncbi:MAG: Uma2 family endonuclease [Cyanobacteria bacterium P01_D01_bin.14]
MTQAADKLPRFDDNSPDIDFVPPPPDLESNEPPLESDLHRDQINLLLELLNWYWRDRDDYYATGNLTIYYNERQLTTRDFRGPDFFVVLGTEKRKRKSWMIWYEDGKYPNFILEILSNSTARVDRTFKKVLYQDTFRTPEYLWFDPFTLELQGFRLRGHEYQPIEPNEQGWLWSNELELFLGVHDSQLRFYTTDSELIPSAEERAEAAEKKARAAEERLRQLQVQLRAQGIKPNV